MPRARTPESAAKKILELVSKGDARNVDDAIAQHPELANGKALLLQTTSGATSSSPPSSPPQLKARPRGSGPARLGR